MKIRDGFVSNSSSSSFLVRVYDKYASERKNLLSQDELSLLLDNGFDWTGAMLSGEADCEGDNGLSKFALCNQQDVGQFLVSHGIPFTADVDSGSITWMYKRGGEEVLELRNFGLEHESRFLTGAFVESQVRVNRAFRKITIKEFLEV